MKDYKLVELEEGIEGVMRSPRGKQLVLCMNYEWITPVLTIEFCTKWYELFLIIRDKDDAKDYSFRGYSIHFGHLEDVCPEDVSPYLDHAPNPLCVRLFAARNGYHLDDLADELITGRWQNEYVDDLVMQCERCDGSGAVSDAYDPDGLLPPWCKPRLETCRACKGHGYLKPEGKKQ